MNEQQLYDPDAEIAALGCVWLSAGRILDDCDLTADDFAQWPTQRLWAALVALYAAGSPIDVPNACRELAGDAERVRGTIEAVATAGVVPAQLGWYAPILRRYTAHRRTLEAATRITQAANGQRDPDELAEFARAQIDRIDRDRQRDDTRSWAQILDDSLTRWTDPVTDAVATGWADLDDMLSGGGLRPGHLTVIGARPGVGKSLVATMLAGRTAAARLGVYFASVEMSTEELTDRIAAAATGVNLADLTNRTLTGEQLDALHAGVNRIRDWPLHIDDRVSTIGHVRRAARRVARGPGGLAMVIIDYLQIMDGQASPGASREQAVAGMSRALKLMAKELAVPVVLLSQLNRASTQRADKRPLISDLRESGAVEQDSDEIVLLHRDDDNPDLAGQIELSLAKNRHGRTGTVRLRWQPYISRITDLTHYAA